MAEDRNAELAALARRAVAAAGGLRLLVERMGDLGWRGCRTTATRTC
ncbi:hypothetical protein AB0467_08630 [Streptomyces sp. NPDC052095]